MVNRYEALKHAALAHAGQVDKCGRPYILHPIAVAEAVELSWPALRTARAVALLHDVWEDTDYALPLAVEGDEEWPHQVNSLARLTRSEHETYAEYIERVCGDSVAKVVKLADLWHNLQPERQACLPEGERKGLECRYLKARDRIWKSLGYEWWPEQEATAEGVFV